MKFPTKREQLLFFIGLFGLHPRYQKRCLSRRVMRRCVRQNKICCPRCEFSRTGATYREIVWTRNCLQWGDSALVYCRRSGKRMDNEGGVLTPPGSRRAPGTPGGGFETYVMTGDMIIRTSTPVTDAASKKSAQKKRKPTSQGHTVRAHSDFQTQIYGIQNDWKCVA